MALKYTWIDRVNGVDYVSAEDPNIIAHAVIDCEDSIDKLKNGEILNKQSGEILYISDSKNAPIEGLIIYGKTTQAAEPTPEAPQELKSVGADGDIKVNITRKNLFDYTQIRGFTSNGVTVTNNNDGSFSFKGTATGYAISQVFWVNHLPAGIYSLSDHNAANVLFLLSVVRDGVKKFLTGANVEVKEGDTQRTVYFQVNPDSTVDTTFYPMLCAGSTLPSDFEPYQEPTVMTIPTPIALNGIPVTKNGNFTDASGQQWVTDEIDFDKGVRIQRVKEIVLTGNEEGWSQYNISTEGYNSFRNNLFDGVNIGNLQNLCTHYKAYGDMTGFYYGQLQGCYVGTTNEPVCKLVIGDIHSTVEDFKAYLAEQYSIGTPVKVKYVLAEPIETPLTEAELVAYQEYYTNYPNTTIYSDDSAFLNIKYKADTKHYIDNKFNSLEKAILSLGGNV